MSLRLEFSPGIARMARAVYHKSNFTLEYAVQEAPLRARDPPILPRINAMVGVREPKWFGIADTLTMVFSGVDAEFVALDAYTNRDLWTTTTEMPRPNVMGIGKLSLATPPQDTDR